MEGLYIALLSVHGLIRGSDIELGRDADTGGQVLYVVDLAKALARHPGVDRVDLVTRRIFDSRIDDAYERPEEPLCEGARIVRIPFGPRRYLRKESLWPYLGELTDNLLLYFRRIGRVPDAIHGHYADAGLAGARLASVLGVPFVFTAHSLGHTKRARLLGKGQAEESIERKYNLSERIEAEEVALDAARLIVTSTEQESGEQYQPYANNNARFHAVIPPGIDLDRFSPPGRDDDKRPAIARELERFLMSPKRPMVLALSRADERKNVETLVHAYAGNAELRRIANLVLVLGTRERIAELETGAQRVLRRILERIDDHDLYGRVAYPKQHRAEDVPEIYRLAARTRGVFVNPALTEPFGLTLLEAAASGLPVVATNDGGPKEIIRRCRNGVVVDPLDAEAMAGAILGALTERRRWSTWSKSGVRNAARHYTWDGHAERYIKELERIRRAWPTQTFRVLSSRKLLRVERLLVTDIDGTLLGDAGALAELLGLLESASERLAMFIATGRRLGSAVRALKKWKIPIPDVLITSVGSSIYYGEKALFDHAWRAHIDYRWDAEAVRAAMEELPGLELQPELDQATHKVSYVYDSDRAPSPPEIRQHLREHRLSVNVVYSHGMFLDVLPLRASKGLAVRYLAMKWGLGLASVLVVGDSGNDEDMLRMGAHGVVVANYSAELEPLRRHPRIHFAERSNAGGILEGIRHFDFLEGSTAPEWARAGAGA